MKFSYRKDEWLAVYVDDCGDRQIMPFDTYEKAESYLRVCNCRIGVMTTSFYNKYVEQIAEEETPAQSDCEEKLVKIIFDENTIFIGSKGRNFEVVEWNLTDSSDEHKRTLYKDLKSAKVVERDNIEYLVLKTKDSEIVKFENSKVSLFHI